jgi:predicted phage-related endonuclease
MSTATIEQTQEWHEQRKLGIGGSDAAGLFPEDSKYGCPTRLFYEKRGQRPDYERTPAEQRILARGNRLEDVAAEQFTLEYGLKVRRQPTAFIADAPHMRVNIDRQIVSVTREELVVFWPQIEKDLQEVLGDGPCGPGVLELKTSNEWVVRNAMKDGIIPDYIFQLQHGMAVKGYKWGVMGILDTSTFELTSFPMVRNEKLIAIMRERADAFWALVEDGPKPEPPTFPAGDTRCRGCIFRKTCRGEQYLMQLAGEKPDTGYVADDSFSELASDLKDILAQKEVIESTEAEIKERIKAQMQEKGIAKLEIPSMGARVRWAEQKPSLRWDSKALEAEAGTIGRHVHFADYVGETHPELVAEFQERYGKSPSLAEKFKRYGTPSRPFVFVSL